MNCNHLENFLTAIMSDQEIQKQISQATNVDEFVIIAYQIAQEKGYNFTLEELKLQVLCDPEKDNCSTNIIGIRNLMKQLRWARGRNENIWKKIKKLK